MALVRDSGTGTTSNTLTTHEGGNVQKAVFNMPATRASGDNYVTFLAIDNGVGKWNGSPVFNDLNGWSLIRELRTFNSVGSASLFLLEKLNSGDAATSFIELNSSTAGLERFECGVLRYTGAADPPHVSPDNWAEGTSAQATSNGLTASHDDSEILHFCAVDTDHPNDDSWDSATQIWRQQGGSGRVGQGLAFEASPGNGNSTGAEGTSLSAEDDWVAGSIEILPAAPAVAPDEDAGLFILGQHQPVIELPTMTPY